MWLYCTSLWVECTWDVASCSGANSVVSLACICFLLVCQFVPDHAKIVRFVALPGQLTSLLRISHFRKCSISSVTSKPWNSISAQYIKFFFFLSTFPATYRWNLNLQAASLHHKARHLRLISVASFTYCLLP